MEILAGSEEFRNNLGLWKGEVGAGRKPQKQTQQWKPVSLL